MPKADATNALVILLSLTERFTEDRPLEEFLKAVTDAAVSLVEADHASIRLLTNDTLLSSARSGTGSEGPPVEFRRGDGIIGWVVDNKEPAMVGDVTQDPRYRYYPGQTFDIRSMIAEPLWASEEVTGVLSVTSPAIGAFNAQDQLLMRLLANCSAPAIERARLKRLAMFDHITMAFTHRYLYPRMAEEMERALRSRSPLSVLLMDLDHFKLVNDRHGHAVGDDTLRLFSDRVRGMVRRVDVLVRRGGEEFVLIMPATDESQALATAARIQQNLSEHTLQLGAGIALRQTVSIGVATWDGRETPEALQERADAAMYEAKRAGRDRVVTSDPPAALKA